MTSKMTSKETWLGSLHPKRQKEFLALPEAAQELVLSRADRTRRTALRVLDHDLRGINSRNQWVSGLDHLRGFLSNANHFFVLAFDGRVDDMEAMTDVLIDFRVGEHDNVKNTDPLVYSLMQKANEKFVRLKYDQLDAIGMATYFRTHPERRPFKSEAPDAHDIAKKKAMKVGADIKVRRRQRGMSRCELANAVGACEKTIKNMELGKPVSSHTMLMANTVLAQPKTVRSLPSGQSRA